MFTLVEHAASLLCSIIFSIFIISIFSLLHFNFIHRHRLSCHLHSVNHSMAAFSLPTPKWIFLLHDNRINKKTQPYRTVKSIQRNSNKSGAYSILLSSLDAFSFLYYPSVVDYTYNCLHRSNGSWKKNIVIFIQTHGNGGIKRTTEKHPIKKAHFPRWLKTLRCIEMQLANDSTVASLSLIKRIRWKDFANPLLMENYYLNAALYSSAFFFIILCIFNSCRLLFSRFVCLPFNKYRTEE